MHWDAELNLDPPPRGHDAGMQLVMDLEDAEKALALLTEPDDTRGATR
jgi:hypothetical protein